MKKYCLPVCFLFLLGAIASASQDDFRGRISAALALASLKARSVAPVVPVTPDGGRKTTCTHCKGKGRVPTGDGISTTECDYCRGTGFVQISQQTIREAFTAAAVVVPKVTFIEGPPAPPPGKGFDPPKAESDSPPEEKPKLDISKRLDIPEDICYVDPKTGLMVCPPGKECIQECFIVNGQRVCRYRIQNKAQPAAAPVQTQTQTIPQGAVPYSAPATVQPAYNYGNPGCVCGCRGMCGGNCSCPNCTCARNPVNPGYTYRQPVQYYQPMNCANGNCMPVTYSSYGYQSYRQPTSYYTYDQYGNAYYSNSGAAYYSDGGYTGPGRRVFRGVRRVGRVLTWPVRRLFRCRGC